jgi:geranylgeranylglycerol-phosphate geranylgeranyltransferase
MSLIKSLFAYIEIIRPINCIMAALAVYVASVIAGLSFLPSLSVIAAMAVVFFVTAGGMAINDYFDEEIDRINRPSRPIPSGRIPGKVALLYSFFLFIAGVGLSYMINAIAFSVAVFSSLLLILYAWKLKKMLFIGHLAVSLLTALTFIYGGLINMELFAVSILALLAFLSNIGREIFKTIEDVLGDEKSDVKSLPIKYGTVKARMAASIFVLAGVATSFAPFFLEIFGPVYLFFVVIADIIFIASMLAPTSWAPKLCKIGMNIALVAFFLGAYALTL